MHSIIRCIIIGINTDIVINLMCCTQIQRTNFGVELIQRTVSTSVWGGLSQVSSSLAQYLLLCRAVSEIL